MPGSLLPAGGTIPANTPELRWHLGANAQVKSPKRHLSLTRGATKVAFDLEPLSPEVFRIIPKDPLVVGDTYVLTADNACKYLGPKTIEATFVVGPKAALPTTLGRVAVRSTHLEPLKIGTAGGSCNVQERAAWVDLEVELSAEAKPWSELIDYAVSVDGRAWRYADTIGKPPPPGQSVLGRGKARVYARCAAAPEAFEGVGEGEHAVAIEGSVFATGTALPATPLPVAFDCKTGARAVETVPAGAAKDAPPENDSATPPGDPSDPGAEAKASAAPTSKTPPVTADPPSSSASCTVSDAGSPVGLLWLLGVLGLRRSGAAGSVARGRRSAARSEAPALRE